MAKEKVEDQAGLGLTEILEAEEATILQDLLSVGRLAFHSPFALALMIEGRALAEARLSLVRAELVKVSL